MSGIKFDQRISQPNKIAISSPYERFRQAIRPNLKTKEACGSNAHNSSHLSPLRTIHIANDLFDFRIFGHNLDAFDCFHKFVNLNEWLASLHLLEYVPALFGEYRK